MIKAVLILEVSFAMVICSSAFASSIPSDLVCESLEGCGGVASHLSGSFEINGKIVTGKLNRIWMCKSMLESTVDGKISSVKNVPGDGGSVVRVEFDPAVPTMPTTGPLAGDPRNAKSGDFNFAPDFSSADLTMLDDTKGYLGTIHLQCRSTKHFPRSRVIRFLPDDFKKIGDQIQSWSWN